MRSKNVQSIKMFKSAVQDEGIEIWVWESRKFGWNFPDEELNVLLDQYLETMEKIYKKIGLDIDNPCEE